MKIIMASFTELKENSKMHTIHKRLQIHKETGSEKKQAQGVKLPDIIYHSGNQKNHSITTKPDTNTNE